VNVLMCKRKPPADARGLDNGLKSLDDFPAPIGFDAANECNHCSESHIGWDDD
jgi:hypothetical protein